MGSRNVATFFTLKVIRNIINIFQRGQTGIRMSINLTSWQCFPKGRSTIQLQIATFLTQSVIYHTKTSC